MAPEGRGGNHGNAVIEQVQAQLLVITEPPHQRGGIDQAIERAVGADRKSVV